MIFIIRVVQCVLQELGVPLMNVAGPELVAGVSGESEERIRDLFDQAAENAPCILFLDEVDALAPNRHTAQREMERRIVAQLLSCLDGRFYLHCKYWQCFFWFWSHRLVFSTFVCLILSKYHMYPFIKFLHIKSGVRHFQGFNLGRAKCYIWEYTRYSSGLDSIIHTTFPLLAAGSRELGVGSYYESLRVSLCYLVKVKWQKKINS